jgi:hypothetical protein
MDLFAFDTLPEWSHEYVATPAVCAIPAKHPRRFPRILARNPGSRLRQLREVDAKMKRLESRLFPMIRASLRYQERRDPQAAFRMRLRELAASRLHVGYRGLTTSLRRDGGLVNAKRIYRRFADEGVTARNKNHSKTAYPAVATVPNQQLSMDFICTRVDNGRWFWILTVIDEFM